MKTRCLLIPDAIRTIFPSVSSPSQSSSGLSEKHQQVNLQELMKRENVQEYILYL
jgi:hypothetical protein